MNFGNLTLRGRVGRMMMMTTTWTRLGGRRVRSSSSTTTAAVLPRTVYLNGAYMPENEAKISVFDRGFQFSDSVYEVTSVLEGKLVDFHGHMRRLQRSLRELDYTYVPDADEYLTVHRALTRRNHVTEGIVYVQVTRGVAVDRSFTHDAVMAPPTVFLMTQNLDLVHNAQAEHGIRVVSIPDQRWRRRDIKTTQLLYQAMGKMQAQAAGVDDAWMVESIAIGGNGGSCRDDPATAVVTEGTSNNAWIVRDGTIVTRATDNNDILAGITRATVLRLLRESSQGDADENNHNHKLRFQERPFTLAEVYDADEAFCTSSSSFVMPVIEMDGHVIGDGTPGPWTRRLREIYLEESRKAAI